MAAVNRATHEDMEAVLGHLWPDGFTDGKPVNPDNPGTHTIPQIAKALDMDTRTVRSIVQGLKKAGVPVQLPTGSAYQAFAAGLGIKPTARPVAKPRKPKGGKQK